MGDYKVIKATIVPGRSEYAVKKGNGFFENPFGAKETIYNCHDDNGDLIIDDCYPDEGNSSRIIEGPAFQEIQNTIFVFTTGLLPKLQKDAERFRNGLPSELLLQVVGYLGSPEQRAGAISCEVDGARVEIVGDPNRCPKIESSKDLYNNPELVDCYTKGGVALFADLSYFDDLVPPPNSPSAAPNPQGQKP